MAGKRRGVTPPQPLGRRLAGLSRGHLLAVTAAAGASPAVRHRWMSVGHLFHLARQLAPTGGRRVTADMLPGLLAACLRDEPALRTLEDFVPPDPRDIVYTRWTGQLLRLFPGCQERPVADVERWRMVSCAIDDVIRQDLGFGIDDLVSVALRHVDASVAEYAKAWPASALPGDGPPFVTAAELTIANALAGTEVGQPLTEGEAAALAWATTGLDDAPYAPDHPQSAFGPYLRTRLPSAATGNVAVWLPMCFVPETVECGVSLLARRASGSPGAARAWAQVAADRTRRALWRFSSQIIGPPDWASGPAVSDGDVVQWVATLGPARAVIVQMVSTLDGHDFSLPREPAAVRVCATAHANPDAPIAVPMPGGQLTLDPRTEVVPLVVIATASHVVAPQWPSCAGMALEDLTWAAATADEDSDLFLYCREMANPSVSIFGWEAINYWEVWRSSGKTFFPGAVAPTFMMITPHHGEAEWNRHRDLADLDQALAALDLPSIASSDGLETSDHGPSAVYSWAPTTAAGAASGAQRGDCSGATREGGADVRAARGAPDCGQEKP